MGWIGVDLDKTLAYDEKGWNPSPVPGEPVPRMMSRVKKWIASGKEVKIFTARASQADLIPHIKKWLTDNGLPDLEITNQKDMEMDEYWDDKAVQVEPNTGRRADGKPG